MNLYNYCLIGIFLSVFFLLIFRDGIESRIYGDDFVVVIWVGVGDRKLGVGLYLVFEGWRKWF